MEAGTVPGLFLSVNHKGMEILASVRTRYSPWLSNNPLMSADHSWPEFLF